MWIVGILLYKAALQLPNKPEMKIFTLRLPMNPEVLICEVLHLF